MAQPKQERKRFVWSDPHFSHDNTWAKFKLSDGVTPLRNFKSSEEMDQYMIDRWNETVGDNDVCYLLGDVVINRKAITKIHALRGEKRLVLGNHDCVNLDIRDYLAVGFTKVYGVTKPPQFPFYLSHMPIHECSLPQKWCVANIHGHMHGRRVMMTDKFGKKRFDPRYICVSVENICYTPVDLNEILDYANKSENIWGKTYCWDEGESDYHQAT